MTKKNDQGNTITPDKKIKYVEVRPIPHLNIPELVELDCVRPENSEDRLLFYCAPKEKYRGICPKCSNSYSLYAKGDATDRKAYDISHGLVKVVLKIKNPRYLCNSCGASFTHPFSSLVQGRKLTKRLYEQLKKRALNESYSSIARDCGVSITTIAEILKEYGTELGTGRTVTAPRVLGIDEKHIAHEKRGVFVDVERGVLLELTPNNKSETMIAAIETLEGYDGNITHVTIDMYNPYVSVIETCLPNAKIIVDHYHVIQNLVRQEAAYSAIC